MKRIAIIGAMAEEVAYLSDLLRDKQQYKFGHNIYIHVGKLHDTEVVLCQSGIGKVNAAVATTLAIDRFAAEVVINTGSAGGVGAGLRVGDVVIGIEIAHHDVDVTAFGYAVGQIPQQPMRYHSDKTWVSHAHHAARIFNAQTIAQGLIVSGDQFVHSSEAIARIRDHFADVQAIEMEAAAIAQTCYQLNTPFVIIRAISDSAEEKANISFEQFLKTAALHSAQMVQEMLRIC